MKDRRTTRSTSFKLHQKPISNFSPMCDEFPQLDLSQGPSQFRTLFELLNAVILGLNATNSPFVSAVREAQHLTLHVAAIYSNDLANAVANSLKPENKSTAIADPPILDCPTVSAISSAHDDVLDNLQSLLDSSASLVETNIAQLEENITICQKFHLIKASYSHRAAVLTVSQAEQATKHAETSSTPFLTNTTTFNAVSSTFLSIFQFVNVIMNGLSLSKTSLHL